MAKPILDGLVICDFSWVGAGPITTQNLGMMGATVIHIETHKRPEILRMNPPFKDRKPGVERSGYFSPRNANKLGLSLDLSKPEAIAVVKRLLTISDILSSSLTLAVRTVIWAISVSTCLRQAGWQNKYGHSLLLLETFVEVDRFRGTCYKAANWRYAGLTKGRSRNDRYNTLACSCQGCLPVSSGQKPAGW